MSDCRVRSAWGPRRPRAIGLHAYILYDATRGTALGTGVAADRSSREQKSGLRLCGDRCGMRAHISGAPDTRLHACRQDCTAVLPAAWRTGGLPQARCGAHPKTPIHIRYHFGSMPSASTVYVGCYGASPVAPHCRCTPIVLRAREVNKPALSPCLAVGSRLLACGHRDWSVGFCKPFLSAGLLTGLVESFRIIKVP